MTNDRFLALTDPAFKEVTGKICSKDEITLEVNNKVLAYLVFK